jgi:uncharacterized protein YybS (DUF2232 family)
MLRRWAAVLAEIVLVTLTAVGCFTAGILFPFLGAVLTLLTPLPLAVLGLRHGRLGLWTGLTLIPIVLTALGSWWQAAAFGLEFAVPALLLAEGLRRGRRSEPLTLAVALCLSLGGVAVMLLGTRQWGDPLSVLQQHVDVLLRDMEGVGARLGLTEGAEALAPSVARMRGWLLMVFPGLFFTGNLLAATGYDACLRWLVRRRPAAFGSLAPADWGWRLPEHLVWFFIAAGACYLSGIPGLGAAGLNGLIALLGFYFLQGVSIALYLFQRFQLPRFLVTISVVVLLLQPVTMLLVAGLGLFDVWCAFRRPGLPSTPSGVS